MNLHQWETDERSDLVNGVHQTQFASSGLVEEDLPLIHVLGGVQKHTIRRTVSSAIRTIFPNKLTHRNLWWQMQRKELQPRSRAF